MYYKRLGHDGQLVYLVDWGGGKVVTKFTQAYSFEAHHACANAGVGPKLLIKHCK